QVVRLRPAPHCRTRILSYSLKVTPEKHFINWQQDPQSNYLARLVFPEQTEELRIEVDLVAELSVINPFDFFLEPHAEKIPFDYRDPALLHELAPYLVTLPLSPRFTEYLAKVPREPKATVNFLVELNQRVYQDVNYLIRLEPGVQSPEETLEKGSGSCRDSAWLLVQLLRHLGLAARFVSGYLIQLTPDVKALDGPSGPVADFTDLHAWCEVYLPGAGWVGLDPTSGLFAGEGHLPLACSPEPSSAAPITGLTDQCEVEFQHHMKVERIWEAPRVTKPYTEEQWAAIEALGHDIDRHLRERDVRLTMGGEPTFVAVDDPDGEEWNTAALGPTKRYRALELYKRLRDKYAPQGLCHFGQGKWYPGEQLPRWSLNCYWRKDGEPVWLDNSLYADERKHYGADAALAAEFLHGLAARLGLDSQYVFPAYEDAFYYLWKERKLPVNVDPLDSRLSDPLERARMAKVFSQGLEKVIGHVLPLARNPRSAAWQTGPWFLRGEHCFLIPGDSPIGYRLPLDGQPWVSEADYPYIHQPDTSQPFGRLKPHAALRHQLQHSVHPGEVLKTVPEKKKSAAQLTRTALCAEPRDGKLYLFMPPLAQLDDYLELVAAIEATAGALGMPVIMEGYEPPSDPRLTHFRITPDPGVIEVNIHPSAGWDDLVERTTHLYEAAHQCRLTTEKFMVDGRHTGTGGGNHFVLGGATPGDSPFLRRPDLLRSLISYWHNHPSLSYLFSGLFIGPTSQAPRVDEARNDSLYELEIAFRQFPQPGSSCPPWLVDRLLRNLLIDVTG
ncbi:MAG TPA: transglutaminase family protein, partial [Fluviicoccus sp.]|nr:transglutaminase family protein [Fluviicoccus sp.]